MTVDEIIKVLRPLYKFKVITEIDGFYDTTGRELTLEFEKQQIITKEDIEKSLKPYYRIIPHIVVSMNIVAILVDVNKPHIALQL